MKYYLIAGEASGDMHGANLIRGLQKADPGARFRFWGGDQMAEAAGTENLVRHYKTASFFGFLKVVMNLPVILRQLRQCKADIAAYSPDAVILIDYPGFNFKIAKFAHKAGFKVFYYISSKVWAWKESRVESIRKYVDKLFIIFPFEIDYFRARGIDAVFEGNPLVDAIEAKLKNIPPMEEFLRQNDIDADKPMIALLAGSRRTELEVSLPFMVSLSREFPQYRFVVAGVSWLERSLYDKYLSGSDVRVVYDAAYAILKYSQAAVVTSGTATLEAALIGTPEIVCYGGDALSVWLARKLIKVKYISLVNLIMDREVVRELIQKDMNAVTASRELRAILPGGESAEKMREDFGLLKEKVGSAGASDRFAARMVAILKNDK